MHPITKNQIKYLVHRKFPGSEITDDNPHLRVKISAPHVGLWSEERPMYISKVRDYHKRLSAISPKDLTEIYNLAKEEERHEYEQLDRALPFNQPEANADCDYWGKYPEWTLDQLTALSFNKDPFTVNMKSISPHLPNSPFAREYMKRYELFRCAQTARELGPLVKPKAALKWCSSRIGLPQELINAVMNQPETEIDLEILFQEQGHKLQAANDEIDSLKKQIAGTKSTVNALNKADLMIYGLTKALLSKADRNIKDSIEQNGPLAENDPTMTLIQSVLDKQGVKIDRKTIAKHYKNGKEQSVKAPID